MPESWLSFTHRFSNNRLLNFGVLLSVLGRRIAVERGGVSPITVGREEEEEEEEEEDVAWEGEVTIQLAERVDGALYDSGQFCI